MKKIVLVLLLILFTFGCGEGKRTDANDQPALPELVVTDNPLLEAIVIEASGQQINSSELCPIRVRARFPDKNGEFEESGAIAACSLNIQPCDRVYTNVYSISNGKGGYTKTPRIAELDPRPEPDDFVCPVDGVLEAE